MFYLCLEKVYMFLFKGNALWVQFVYCACADQFTVGFWHKMASAKFLEEALSTDVDESAVNAIVGSLETQLVSPTPSLSNQQGTSIPVNQNHLNGSTLSNQKHSVSNGGSESMNVILNSDSNKIISNSALQSVMPTSVVSTVVASLQGGVPTSGYLNQVASNVGLGQSNLTNLNKSQDTVKLVYPSGSQNLPTPLGINRVSYPNNQTVSSIPNGNVGLTPLTSNTVLSASSSLQSVVSNSYSQAGSNVGKQLSVGMDQKPTGTALVIKSSGNNHVPQGSSLPQGLVSTPMTVSTTMTLTGSQMGTTTTSGVPGIVTFTKPLSQTVGTQQVVGNPPTTILPANVQILNVNTIRSGTPAQPGQKSLPPRVMTIGTPQVVGARPGQPGQITLQALQGLQGAQGGHLLLKTENGQYQLLRVGPATTTPTAAIAPNNAANTAFRVQSVPAPAGTD
uniref:Uncharacterized protein n=1 Tax=Clastoptera arizonana TaxID=38151 RepID=A0A1B6D124_9HEMI